MSQPNQTQPAEESFSVILTQTERAILLAFLDAGLRYEINRVGLSKESAIIAQNAVGIAARLHSAPAVPNVPRIVTPEDITDVPQANP